LRSSAIILRQAVAILGRCAPRVVGAHAVRAQRLDLRREGLRRPRGLAGYVARGHRAFLDGEHRLSARPVEHEELARLRRLEHGGDVLSVTAQRREHGRRRVVIVQQVVVHGLEVPRDLARRGAQRDDGVRVVVAARPVDAVVVGRRARGRRVDEAARRIADHDRPHVGAARDAAGVVRPAPECGIVARLRDRIPAPAQCPRARVEGAHLAARRREPAVVRDRGADDDEPVDRERRRGLLIGGELEGCDTQALAQVDRPVRPEVRAGLSARRVERDETRVDGCQVDTPAARRVRRSLRIEPGRDAAIREVAEVLPASDARIVEPALRAGVGIESEDAPERRREIQRAVDDDRRGLELRLLARRETGRAFARVEGPCDRERGDVRGRDVAQWRVPAAVRVAAVHGPVGATRVVGTQRSRVRERHADEHDEYDAADPSQDGGHATCARGRDRTGLRRAPA
jgi:hypothetical protein